MRPGQYKPGQREGFKRTRTGHCVHEKSDLVGARKLKDGRDFPPPGYEAFDSYLSIVVPHLIALNITVFYVSNPGHNCYAVQPWVLRVLPIVGGFKSCKMHRDWWNRAIVFVRDNDQARRSLMTVLSLTNNRDAAQLLESLMGEPHPTMSDFV